jgi:hypothetical protein
MRAIQYPPSPPRLGLSVGKGQGFHERDLAHRTDMCEIS